MQKNKKLRNRTITIVIIFTVFINLIIPMIYAQSDKNNNNVNIQNEGNNSETTTNTSINKSINNTNQDYNNDEKEEEKLKQDDNSEVENEENFEKTRTVQDGKQTIQNGTYKITVASKPNLVLDVSGSNKSNGANVLLWTKGTSKNQNFEITYLQDGYYTIKASHSKKSLDVASASKILGTNVQQYESNGTDAQKWIIKDEGNEQYSIISKCNNLSIDIQDGKIEKGSNIQMYKQNGTKAQKFKFEKVEELKCDKLVEEGTYYISSALSEKKVISVDNGKYSDFSNVNIWDKNGKEYQKFKLTYDQNLKAYTITAIHSDKVLDVYSGNQGNYTNVDQYSNNNTDAQKWILKEAGDGYYYIISKCNSLYLDINGANSKNGTNVQMYEGNKTNAQKFKFIQANVNTGTKTIKDGTYKIVTKIDNEKVFQIEGQSTGNNARVQAIDELNVINKSQSFDIKYLNNGYYSIKAKKTGKAIEVKDGVHTNGAGVQQNKYNNSTIQQWIIKDAGDGYYYLISRCNGLYIDIPNGNTSNNPYIQMYQGNSSNAQKFKFVEVEDEIKKEKVVENGVYKISTALDQNKFLDISGGAYADCANLQIWSKDNVQQQKFQITYNEQEKYYEIKSVNSGRVLDVANNGKTDGTNVWQYVSNNTDAQKWILQSAGNGYYYIIAANSYLYLDVNGGKTSNGTNVQLYEGNASKAQKFKFTKTTMIESDSYKISIRQDANKVLDIDAGSTSENANLQIWSEDGVNQQMFKVEYIDNTYCKIIAKHSDKVLTVKNNNVVQATYTGADNQKWEVEIGGNGYYKIKSKSTGLYLDVSGNKTANGTNIQVYKDNMSFAQIFKFNYITQKYGIDVSEHNGIINWLNVGNSKKADFAIIRAGYRGFVTGRIVTDAQFEKNIIGAKANGIDIGLYFFTQAVNTNEAIEEANYVLDLVRKYKINVKYPIVIDTENSGSKTNGVIDNEGRADRLDVGTRTAVCRAFCDTIRNAGYTPAVYASRDWFYNNLNVSQLGNCDIWVAHYTGNISNQTNYRYSYNIWQYTNSGRIPGINTNVDLNISYKKY